MISMSNFIGTHLQALYHSGKITSYIHSNLPDGQLRTGWIEQGLLSKGMKGALRDKRNQESIVIPADRFARLARDRGEWKEAVLVIIGPRGLTTSKFTALVMHQEDIQSLIAFQTQKASPNEIIKILLETALGKKTSEHLEEPNLDYIEQLKIDAAESEIDEMTVLTLPKKQVKISEWMKEALLSPSSDSVEFQKGTSKKMSKFAALITRWLTGLELFRNTSNRIATIIFINSETMDVCFWDQPQRKVVFAMLKHNNLESISRKYMIPLWLNPGEGIETLQPTREVIFEPKKPAPTPRKSSVSEKQILSSTTETEKALIALSERLDSLESSISSSNGAFDALATDRGVMEVLQSRLAETIDRIETLAKRLDDLEKRLKNMRT